MASEVGIVNMALSKLGVAALTALTDDSPAARLANREYSVYRDEMLREHPWGWATKRASIAASVTGPAWEFENAYPLPADCLKVQALNNPSRYDYQIERTADGTVIATNLPTPLEIKYTARVTDPNDMDDKFREALAARLALEWSEALTGISTLSEALEKRYLLKLKDAKGIEGQENSVSEYAVYSWTNARF